MLLIDCKNDKLVDCVYIEKDRSDMNQINEFRRYCTEDELRHLDNLNLISEKLLFCSDLMDTIEHLEEKTADEIFQLAQQKEYLKTRAGNCLSGKFSLFIIV